MSDAEYADWFQHQLKPEGDCKVWTGGRHQYGYGTATRNGVYRSHRIAYTLVHGAIPSGSQVRHLCDNPPCCNPDHLVIGTHKENARDMMLADRTTSSLSWKQVEEIRHAGEAVGWCYGTQTLLAREYSVALGVVHSIRKGRR